MDLEDDNLSDSSEMKSSDGESQIKSNSKQVDDDKEKINSMKESILGKLK